MLNSVLAKQRKVEVVQGRGEFASANTIRVETALAPGLWPTYADRHQLESALLNLVVNARDALSGRGRIVLRTHAALPGGPCLTVEDAGPGMSEAIRRRARARMRSRATDVSNSSDAVERTINIGHLNSIADSLVSSGKALEQSGSIVINLREMGYDKLLGAGKTLSRGRRRGRIGALARHHLEVDALPARSLRRARCGTPPGRSVARDRAGEQDEAGDDDQPHADHGAMDHGAMGQDAADHSGHAAPEGRSAFPPARFSFSPITAACAR